MTHGEYVEILKSTIAKLVIKSATQAVFKKIPFMAWGPLGPLASFLIEKFVWLLLTETEMVIFLNYTDFRVNRQGRAFSEAAQRNFELQRSGTPEEKMKAEEELISSFRAFVKLHN